MSALILGSAYRRIPALELEYLTPRPSMASHVSVTVDDGIIYAHSGLTSSLTSLGETHKYSVKDGSWELITGQAPTFRSVGLGVYDNGLFIHGGYNQENYMSRSTTNRLDISTGVLTTRAISPTPVNRYDNASVIADQRLYLFGGTGLNTYGYLDLSSNQWVGLGNCPMSIRFSGVARNGRDVYFVAGIEATGSTVHGRVCKYNLDTNSWVLLPSLPVTPNSSAHALWVQDRLVCFIHDVQVRMFVLEDLTWVEKRVDIEIPIQRLTQSVQIDNHLYTVGGFSSQGRLNLLTRLTVNKL